jgi:hypothetical protein
VENDFFNSIGQNEKPPFRAYVSFHQLRTSRSVFARLMMFATARLRSSPLFHPAAATALAAKGRRTSSVSSMPAICAASNGRPVRSATNPPRWCW